MDEVLRWRMELSEFDLDIVHRSGNWILLQGHPIGFTVQAYVNTLRSIHSSLYHAGITRFYHYVRAKDQPTIFCGRCPQ